MKRPLPARAVVGRPVRYWGADDADDDARAVGRMRAALAEAGFTEVVFELEPIAAALRYAAGLDHEELILVADFGGGTSDFSLLRVGPRLAPGDAGVILATGGVALGGDSFDARIIDALVAPALGRETTYRDAVRGHDARAALAVSAAAALAPPVVLEGGEHARAARSHPSWVVRSRAGSRGWCAWWKTIWGFRCIRRSSAARWRCRRARRRTLVQPQLDLAARATRAAFEQMGRSRARRHRRRRRATCLSRAGVTAADVDTVFATGGSALVPAVRRRLAARFGEAKLAGGEELTSVAWGLAARARQLFGGA